MTTRTRMGALFGCLLLLSGWSSPALAQQGSGRLELRPPKAKPRAPRDRGRTPVVLDDSNLGLVRASLDDASPAVREAALAAVARRTLVGSLDTWRAERPVLMGFKGRIVECLQDSDTHVRLAAIRALVRLEIDRNQSGPAARVFDADVAQAMMAQYAVDGSDLVRAELVSALGWHSTPPGLTAPRDRLLGQALADASPAVVHAAALSVAMQRVRKLLGPLVAAIGNPNASVRVIVAQAIAQFGPEARSYLPSLQAALASETDVQARKTLEGSIRAITR